MFSTSHEPKRGIDAAGRKGPVGKRPQRALFDQPRNLLQHLAGQFFITVENRIHSHDVERRIVAEGPKRDARVLVNIAFADLDEAAEFGETGETHRDRFPGECVQNDVHSLAIGYLHHRLSKIAASRVDHVFHSERFKQSTFARDCRRWRSLPLQDAVRSGWRPFRLHPRPREQGRARPRAIAPRFEAHTTRS